MKLQHGGLPARPAGVAIGPIDWVRTETIGKAYLPS